METQIIDAYKEMLIGGDEPVNAFTLCKKLGIEEKEFFNYFSSTDDIGRKIWAGLAQEVIDKLNGSEEFRQYSAREKVLAYYFTFFEVALAHRSFIELTLHRNGLLRSYRDRFKEFLGDIIQEGIAGEEIIERFSLSNFYPDMLWQLHLRLLHFWLEDSSEHFVDTERAIEVYSKLPLEIMGHNLLDSFLETAKFSVDQLRNGRFEFLDRFNVFRRS